VAFSLHSRLFFLAAGATLAATLLVACGDDDDGGSVAYDPNKADAIAHAAMLAAADLPGSGWTISGQDEFADSDFDVPANTTACMAIKDAVAKAPNSELNRVGRAQVTLSRSGSLFETGVESQVSIYKDTSTPSAIFSAFKSALGGDNFENCMQDVVQQGAGDAKFETKSSTAQASAPNGGIAKAIDVKVTVAVVTVTVHFEFYVWQDSNAGVTVSLNGPKEDLTADVVKAALDKTQQKLSAQK
jgi:hypothetical protein